MYNNIGDFLDKIQEARNFDYGTGSDAPLFYRNAFYGCDKSGLASSKSIKSYLTDRKLIFKAELNNFERMPTKTTATKAMEYVLVFFADIFSSMCSYFVETERIVAKDEDFFEFEDLENDNDERSGYFSSALKYLFPGVWNWWNKEKFEKHKISSIREDADVKIFPQGKPLPKEVKQAGIGDCYLMSALIALAKNQPKVITDCFVQGLHDIDNNDNIIIRFYGENKSGDWGPIEIEVNKKKVVMPEKIKDGALWPKLIEKAFIVYENRGSIKRGRIDGGTGEQIFKIMTGKSAKVISSTENIGKRVKDLENILSVIESKLKNKYKCYALFKNSFTAEDKRNGNKEDFNKSTPYQIIDVIKMQSVVFKLKRKEDFTMDLFDFYDYYSELEYKKIDRFEKLEKGPNIISKIKSALGEKKKVLCSFNRGDINDVIDGKSKFLIEHNNYVIEDVKEEVGSGGNVEKQYVVIKDNHGESIAISVKDFLDNYKKVKYEKSGESEKQPDIILKMKSVLQKKKKQIICKFKDTLFLKDVVYGYRYSISKKLEYIVEKIDKEKSEDYVTVKQKGSSQRINLSVKDFLDNYKVIRYQMPRKAPEERSTDVEPNIISKVRSALNKGKAITCSFGAFSISDAKSGESFIIHNHHAYAIVGINEKEKYIRLIDPNKSLGRKAENSPKSKEGGHIAMRFNDFADNILDITYAKV